MAGKNTLRAQAKLGDRTLHMTFQKWMDFEDASGRDCNSHFTDIELGLGAHGLVRWVCAFVDGEMTETEAIELISSVGHKETLEALGKVLRSYLGLPEDGQENPPKAA